MILFNLLTHLKRNFCVQQRNKMGKKVTERTESKNAGEGFFSLSWKTVAGRKEAEENVEEKRAI